MKKTLLLAIVFYGITVIKLYAQPPAAGVYLFCNNFTTGSGTVVNHRDEVEIITQDEGATLPVTIGPGGPTIARPSIADFVITKTFDRSSMRFRNRLLSGQALPNNLEIRYYDGVAPGPVYVVILVNCFISSILNNNVKCTGNCPDVSETYSFSPVIIIWRNQAVTPNQVITYDRVRNQVTSSGL
jgi:type VI protein secretion system component Hcp